jgi:hypothetical protein
MAAIRTELDRSGYFPRLVGDTVDLALANETPLDFLVITESALGHGTIGWHSTVLVLTATRLVVTHVDDAVDDEGATAAATTNSVPLRSIRSVKVATLVEDPASYPLDGNARSITVSVGWGGQRQIELEDLNCGDPECQGEHGFSGTAFNDDLSYGGSQDPELGIDTARAMDFTKALIAAQVQAMAA